MSGSNDAAVSRVLTALHKDKDGRVRRSAALALGKMQARQAIPDLREALDDSGEVAFAAAKALADLGDQTGRDTLVAILAGKRRDSPGLMTNMVREAQHRIHHPEGMMLMGAESATGAVLPPASMGLDAARQIMALYDNGAPGRASAVDYIAKDPEPYALSLLEWALSDSSAAVRWRAAQALGYRGNDQTIAKLEPLLKDSHKAVADMAAAAILKISTGDRTAPAGEQTPLLTSKK